VNPIDDQLNRLFRAAQQAPISEIAPPFGLETRVLAAWRETGRTPASFWDMSVLTRGLVLAGIIMAACMAPALGSFSSSTTTSADYLQMADSGVDTDAYP
jgi:hypothetical protein